MLERRNGSGSTAVLAIALAAALGCHRGSSGDSASATSSPPAHVVANGAPAVGDLRKVGRVDFQISCQGMHDDFERTMALLHSFFYQEARRLFTELTVRDPSCAIAYWGIAMTWYHPLWAPPSPDELANGRAAIEQAQRAATKSDYEKSYIDALAVFYAVHDQPADGSAAGGMSCHGPTEGHSGRAIAYAAAMETIYAAHPDDVEAAAFYALSVLGSAKAVDPALTNQRKAAAILEKFWAIRHDHPGLAHYLIHAYDSPQLASRGLEAAKLYADIAPWVPHALHMPSHIFVRLGMWDDAIKVNQASVDASRNYSKDQKLEGMSFDELHALDYWVFSDLQTGRDGEAKQLAEYVMSVKKTYPEIDFVASYAVGAIPARYAVERHAWKEAAALVVPAEPFWAQFPFAEAHIEYARGLGRARSGDLAGAKTSLARLGELRAATSDPRYDYFKQHLALQQQAVAAWIDHAEGKNDQAVASLRGAAALEIELGKHPVSPGPINAIYEQLGDLLLELDRPGDALDAYTTALKSSPGRLNSLLGAGLAAEKAGNLEVARRYDQLAIAQTRGGDSRRPDLEHAQAFVAR